MTLLCYPSGILHNSIRDAMTRRMSLRAAAREIYEGTAASGAASPSPHFASASGRGEQQGLTAQARALYEDSAVPVREIARLAGVSERTVYKYVIKHDWKRRYRCVARDVAVAAANCGRRWQRAEGFVTAKGAGGRFIRREDAGKPFATGLKATDAAGRARAEAACAAAALRARDAATKAELGLVREAQIRAIEDTNRAIAAWRTFHGEVAGQEEARAVRKSTKARKDEPARQARRTSRWRSWQQPSGAAFSASADEPWKHRTRPPAERAKSRGLSPQQQALDDAYMMTVEASLRSWRFLLERERALQGLVSPLAGSAPETPPK